MDSAHQDEPFSAGGHGNAGPPWFHLAAPDPSASRRLLIRHTWDNARVAILGTLALPFILLSRATALLYALAPGLFSIGCLALGGLWGYQHTHKAIGAVLGALTGMVIGGVILPFVPALLTLALMLAIAATAFALFKV